MQNNETPTQWAERMRDTAPDGDTAYHYHQLAELYRKLEDQQ